jgi:hypothetical protein
MTRIETLTLKTVAVTPDPQVNFELEIPHEPFEDLRVNPEPKSQISGFVFILIAEGILPEAVAV